MNKICIRIIPLLFAALHALNLSAQKYYSFENSVNGVDFLLYHMEDLDFGISNAFEFTIDGSGFKVDLPNVAESTCRVSAELYKYQQALQFKDGKVYTFHFVLRTKKGTQIVVKENVTYIKPKFYSLSIGINSNGSLKSAQQSAADFNSICKETFFFPQYTKGHSYLIPQNECSPEALNEKLDQLRKEVRENDLIVIYFAGHGQVDKYENYYLCLDNGLTYSSFALRDRLMTMAKDSQKIIIASTCYSSFLWDALYSVPNTILIYASNDLTDGEIFANSLLSVIEKGRKQEMRFDSFTNELFDGNHEAGILPLGNHMDFIITSSSPIDIQAKDATGNSWIKPALLSVVFPGLGQFYKKDYLKGSLFAGGTVLTGSGIIVCESLRKKYLNMATQTYDVSVINSLQAKASTLRTVSLICIAGAGMCYLGGILDAAIAPYPTKKGFHIVPNGITYNF